MNIPRIRRSVLAAAAAVALPVTLGITAPMAFAETGSSEPFGTGCASVPKDGAGSFDGMADDPVATAASNNPELSTLVAAVQAADLVDTLNNAKDITVFAPTNDAFEKIPKADLDALLADKESVGGEVRGALSARTSAFGVAVRNVGLRDIVLPGDMKLLLNQVIAAQKEAEANLIRRREETAAARSQANTAKLLSENPQLARLKELEMLKDVLAGTNATFVFGEGDLSTQVRSLVAQKGA